MLGRLFGSGKGAAEKRPTPGPSGAGEDLLVSVSRKLDAALQHHQAGRLPEAEAAYREMLAVDPENNVFKSLRKKLAGKLKDVASNTKSEFGDPWGLVAMDQVSGSKAGAKMLLIGSNLAVFRERK